MARKGNIVVDIKKENPLLTIIKAGKIPVVRLAETGFQNFKQKRYFVRYKDGEYIDSKCNETQKGCFVSVLGVQGNYVCGGHYGEAIHIGYLEPDETVFSTHTFTDKNGYYCEQTAKERFESAKNSYEVYQKGVNEENWDPDDFDLYSEAIVDSKTVRKALVIKPDEYQYLLPYCKDGMFRIFDESTIFYHMVWQQGMSGKTAEHMQKFAEHMHWTLDASHHFFFKDLEVYSLMESSYYKEMMLEEFVNFYSTETFLHTSDFWENFQNSFLEYVEKMKEYFPKTYDEEAILRSLRKDCVYFYHHASVSYREKLSFSVNSESEEVNLAIRREKTYSYDEEIENLKFTEKNILSQKYRTYMYKLVDMKNVLIECMGKYRKIEFPRWMHILETFKKTEEALREWKVLDYTYNEQYHEILIEKNGSFKFLYNMVLLDGVIEIQEEDGSHFYNLENLPETFDRFWLDIILEALKIWESLFNCKKDKHTQLPKIK